MSATRKAIALFLLALKFCAPAQSAVSIVDGISTNISATDPGHLIIVTNGGTLTLQPSFGSTSNQAVMVTGAASHIANTVTWASGKSNTLALIDGGYVAGNGVLFAGDRNSLILSNTSLTNLSGFVATPSSSKNSILLQQGATWFTPSYAMYTSFQITLTGQGALWRNTGLFQTGRAGTSFAISDHARFVSDSFTFLNAPELFSVSPDAQFEILNTLTTGGALKFTGGGTIQSGSITLREGTNILDGTLWRVLGDLNSGFPPSTPPIVILTNSARIITPILSASGDFYLDHSGMEAAAIFPSSSSTPTRIFLANGSTFLSETNAQNAPKIVCQVNGIGSEWRNAGHIPRGAFRISSGGIATNASATIGSPLFLNQIPSITDGPGDSSLVVTGPGSRWQTGSNLWVGFNTSSNAMIISDGGIVSAENAAAGYFDYLAATGNSRIAQRNIIVVSDPGSHLEVRSNFWLGRRCSFNQLIIANGGHLTAQNLNLGYVQSLDEARSNLVRITGQNSSLQLSGVFDSQFSGYSNSLELTDGAQLRAALLKLPERVTVSGGALLYSESSINTSGRQFILSSGASLSCAFLDIHGHAISSDIVWADAGTTLETESIQIAKDYTDKFIVPSPLSLLISNVNPIQVSSMTVGLNSRRSTNSIVISGTALRVTTPTQTGLLQLENANVSIRNNALLEADRVDFIGTNATLNFDVVTLGLNQGVSRLGAVGITATRPPTNSLITAATSAALGGYLSLTLHPTNIFQRGDSITLLKSPNITGQFQNIANGARLISADQTGSFQLRIEQNTVTLADYQPAGAPELRARATYDPAAATLTLLPNFPGPFAVLTSTKLPIWEPLPNPEIRPVSGDQYQWTTSIDPAEPQRFFRISRPN